MTDPWTLEEVDVDGAIQEAAEKVDGATRASFLKKAGIGAGAVMFGGGVAAALPALASAGTAASDVSILNFALTLEYLEAAFYAGAAGRFKGKVGTFAKIVGAHEKAHVAFLKKALGSAAVKSPMFDFKGSNHSQAKFTATAQVLEDTGVAAYLGQAGNIKAKAILGAAGSVLAVEARHAGWIRDINGVTGAPSAFQGPKTKAQILAAVKGTGFITG
ncbi:MAG: ferritin-like domain-containing protein [Actinobacteria bacterium]|nr:ferritin-like domain-containing protein [Actinomycetota bacterium]